MKLLNKLNDLGQIVIDLSAIKINYKIIKKKIGRKSNIAAVLKSDAYGLGINQIAQTLQEIGCKQFFVATINEGIKLRRLIKKSDILILNGITNQSSTSLKKIITFKLLPVLNSYQEIKKWIEYNKNINNIHPVALHFDSGMNRLGISMSELDNVKNLISINKIKIYCIMTHLSSADEVYKESNKVQKKELEKIKKMFANTPLSIANSNAIFNLKNFNYSFVRSGGALFGINPIRDKKNPLKNVVSLFARVLQIRELERESLKMIGYNSTYQVQSKMRIAVLGVGYADGYPRNLSNLGFAIFNQTKLPIVGKISMDYITVDLTALQENKIKEGDWVELIGENIKIELISSLSETIEYEILNNLGYRLKKSYIKKNE